MSKRLLRLTCCKVYNADHTLAAIADLASIHIFDRETGETLFVVELATGRTSARLEMYEPSRKLMACANDGRNMSDLDMTVTGRLPVRDITWLADSSGFFTVQSYGGAAMGGGRACFLDYSRLRHYSVGD